MVQIDLKGKRALVVGGTSGIGNGISQAFRQHGASVDVWGTRSQASDYDPAEGSDLTGLNFRQVDVSRIDSIETLDLDYEGLDILVLCQGTVRYGREEFEREGWDAVMDVNINSVMTCARRLHEPLKSSGGAIIIVSSVAGFGATVGNPAYAASKHAAVGLTKTLGAAWAGDGIRVNGIAPGLVDTKLTKVTTDHPRRLAGALRSIPQGRMGTPQDMAGVALFLVSPLASYVTGQTIIADGGLSLS